jgi:hypothetical protein
VTARAAEVVENFPSGKVHLRYAHVSVTAPDGHAMVVFE